MSDKHWNRKDQDILYLVVLAIVSSLFFLPAVLHPDSLIYPTFSPYSDLTVVHWPKERLLTQTLERYGQFPLWTPLILSGMPLMSNQLAMLFYPLNLVFLVLPPNAAFNLLFITHVFLAGAGLYLFMRHGLAVSGPASLVTALTFAFTGKLLAHVAGGHVSMVGALAWLPWAFLFTHLALARKDLLYSLLTGAVLALQITTHTQILVYTAYALLLYALFEVLVASPPKEGGRLRSLLNAIPTLAPIPLICALLGAVQILPLVELAGYSNRALSLREASAFSLSWLTLFIGLFLPSSKAGHELTIYLGFLPLALAPLALMRRRNRRPLFFAGLAAFCLLFSLGSNAPLFALLHELVPGLRWLRTPARAVFFLALALAVLAGYGFEVLGTGPWEARVRRKLTVGGFYAAIVCLALAAGLMAVYGQVSRATIGLALFPFLSVGFLILGSNTRPGCARLGVAAIIVLLLDLWTFGYSLIRFESPERAFAVQREVVEYIAAQGHQGASSEQQANGFFRLYSPSYSVTQHLAAEFGLQLADGAEPVHLSRYDRFMSVAGGYDHPGFSVTIPYFADGEDIATARRDARLNPTLLGLLNVRYIIAEFPIENDDLQLKKKIGRTHIYENKLALPRAFIASHAEVVSPAAAILYELASLDLRRSALVEGETAQALDSSVPFQGAEITLLSPNKVVVQADLAAPGLLVLSEIWYPGWQAYDNGHPIPIYQTDYILRGVYLDPGRHTVEFVYEPLSLKIGLWVSVVSAVGVFICLMVRLYRHRELRGGAA